MSLAHNIKIELKKNSENKQSGIRNESEIISEILSSNKLIGRIKVKETKDRFFFHNLLMDSNYFTFSQFDCISRFFGFCFTISEFLSIKEMAKVINGSKIKSPDFNPDCNDQYLEMAYYFKRIDGNTQVDGYSPAALMIPHEVKCIMWRLFKKNGSGFESEYSFSKRIVLDYFKDLFGKESTLKLLSSHVNYIAKSGGSKDRIGNILLEHERELDDDLNPVVNNENWLNNLDRKLENNVEPFNQFSSMTYGTELKLSLLYSSYEKQGNKHVYENVMLFTESERLVTSSSSLVLPCDIETAIESVLKNSDVFEISDTYQDRDNQISIVLKRNESYDLLFDAINKLNDDGSLIFSHARYMMGVDKNTAVVLFRTDRHFGKSSIEISEVMPKIIEDAGFLGKLDHISLQRMSMPSHHFHILKVTIDKESIKSTLNSYSPISNLERNTVYEVTKDSLGVTKGTRFSYLGLKYDKVSQSDFEMLMVHEGEVIIDNKKTHLKDEIFKLFLCHARPLSPVAERFPCCKVVTE